MRSGQGGLQCDVECGVSEAVVELGIGDVDSQTKTIPANKGEHIRNVLASSIDNYILVMNVYPPPDAFECEESPGSR